MKNLILAAMILVSQSALASIDVYPWTVNFFDQEVGTQSFPENITITNRGPGDIYRLNISSNCYGTFNVRTYICYGPLRPGQSCEIEVSFMPMYEGYQSCSMHISSDVGSETVWVSGRGSRRWPFPPRETPMVQHAKMKINLLTPAQP